MSEQLESLKTHLAIVKQLPADKIEEQFYNLMLKAKDALGETSFPMGTFYYEYGSFIISKMEKNLDIFNANVVPNNVNTQQQENLDDIPQVYDDSQSPAQQNQAEAAVEDEANPQSAQNQPQIQEEQNNNQPDEQGQKEAPSVQQQQQQEPEEEADDKEISLCNMEFAISIFETQLEKAKNGQTETPVNEILDSLRRARTRLGDLFVLDEKYPQAVDQYRKVIAQQDQREDSQCNRLIAELHFLIGNCFLYDNKQDCENLAIQEFIKAVSILVNHLSLVEHYDISAFQIPSKGKTDVDRFAYLNKPNDSDKVKEIKEVITCLLDKIQDTSEQIGVRAAYESEKKKEEEEKKKDEFKPVEQGTKVINLGNFGNRKKKPDENSAPPAEDASKTKEK